MRIHRHPRTPTILLIPKTLHIDRIFQRSQSVAGQGLHVEDVDALHFAEDFETLETGRLFEIGGDGAGGRAFGH